jgi:hypothetical protein
MEEGNENLVYPSPWDLGDLLHAVKSYDMGPPALLPIRKEGVLRIFSPLKIHRLGRVRTRNLWVQYQAHQPLHHQGDGVYGSISELSGDRGSILGRGGRTFPLACVSRRALGLTQPPVQWVPGVLFPGLKGGRGVTLTTHPHLVTKSRMSWSYISSRPKAASWRVAGQL